MRILDLSFKHVGPFEEAALTFLADENEEPRVAFITGENGTGKTIVLDVIRAMFGKYYCVLNRDIGQRNKIASAVMGVAYSLGAPEADDVQSRKMTCRELKHNDNNCPHDVPDLFVLPAHLQNGAAKAPRWLVDFWHSSLATDRFEVSALQQPKHKKYLSESLSGAYTNADVTHLLCYFDYMKSSDAPRERELGKALFDRVTRIVSASLQHGEFKHVQRSTLTPIISQAGHEVPLANISSGNAYLIQHLISLLAKMLAVVELNQLPPAELGMAEGLLLIDEAENHLHPRWQKKLVRLILEIFPNLQIIATTHSPLIVSSFPGAKVFVCRYDPKSNKSSIMEETEQFENLSIEEVLSSEVFGGTLPFGPEISRLMRKRREAIDSNDQKTRSEIEDQLLAKNPAYFSYFRTDELINELYGETS